MLLICCNEKNLIRKDLVSIIQPVTNVITEISGSKYATCSIIIPIVHCMKAAITNFEPTT